MKNKVVVLFSGGIDSTVCLAQAVKIYGNKNVIAVSFDYGQNNSKELIQSKEICDYYKVEHVVIDIKNIFEFSNSSLIKKSNRDIPHETYDVQYKKLKENENVSTNVPFRNGVMLSICASFALSKNAKVIYYGIHHEEGIAHELYPDCSSEFDYAMDMAIYTGTGKKVSIVSPLVEMSKKEIIELGTKLKIPFNLTWTCYEDNEYACGKCTACIDRIKAFKENDLVDPIKYEG